MTSAEFTELAAFELVEGPISPFERADHRAAQITAMIANSNRDAKKKPKPYKPADFLIDWEKESGVKLRPEPIEVEAKIRGFFAGR